MDRYSERLIKTKASAGSILGLSFVIALTAASLVLVLLSPPLGVLLVCGGIALIVFLKDGLKVEYEFIITNGDIDIAKIYGAKRRKQVASIEVDNMSKMTSADDEHTMNDISIGKYNVYKYLGKGDGDKVVAIYVGEGDNQKIYLLDLDEKCVEHLNQVLKTKSEIK